MIKKCFYLKNLNQTRKQKIETLWKFSQTCKKTLGKKSVDLGGKSKKQV